MGLRLHIRVPDAPARWIELADGGEVVVGRGAGCTLQIAHGTLSSRHGSIRLNGGRVEVRDEGSSNGTQLDRSPLPPLSWVPWPEGTTLWLGDVELAWELLEDDRTVVLDAPQVPAADDPALWSMAMEPDEAASLVSQRLPEALQTPVSGVGAVPVASTAEPGRDSAAAAQPGSRAAEHRPADSSLVSGARSTPESAAETAPAKPPAQQSRGAAAPDEATVRRAARSAPRLLVAAVAGLVCALSAAFGAWVLWS